MVPEDDGGDSISIYCDDRSGRGDADGRVGAFWRKRSGSMAGSVWNLCGSSGRV